MLNHWAQELIASYKSDSHNQFIVHGNVGDKFPLMKGGMGNLDEYLQTDLLAPFDIILTFDIGHGLRCAKGKEVLGNFLDVEPKQPRLAIESVNEVVLYALNKATLNKAKMPHIAVIVQNASQVVPNAGTALSYDLNATASLIRDWSRDAEFIKRAFCSFIVSENVNDLHPLITGNDRAKRVLIPMPDLPDIGEYLKREGAKYPTALKEFATPEGYGYLPSRLTGIGLADLESQLRRREFDKQPLDNVAVVQLKKRIIEKQGEGMLEFIESNMTLDNIKGHEASKKTLRGVLKAWDKGMVSSNPMVQRRIPMGILFAAPVGCSKTYTVKCLAGEAGIPVVIVKNFRDRFVGNTEAKQEKVIRLIKGLGRCFVFFDEASASLGKRDAGTSDSGLSQRIYSTWAIEMSNEQNRGRIIWLLADSRADHIEVDLKRPGRIDIMIPLFPTGTNREGYDLLAELCKREGVTVPAYEVLDSSYTKYDPNDPKRVIECGGENLIPKWLTAGAAEALAKKIALEIDLDGVTAEKAVVDALQDYRPPVPLSRLEEQIRIACAHCTDVDFVPEQFRDYLPT